MNTINTRDKKKRARRKVVALKGFYIHFTVYILVNLFISTSKVFRNMNNGESFSESFWDLGTFFVWVPWGIGLAFHAAKTFPYNPILGKEWEERQIQKYIEKEKKEVEKYR